VTIQDLGSIGEIVAAVATIATLVYLAVQIRQNSVLIRGSTYQASNNWNLSALSAIAQSPEAAATFEKGLSGNEKLAPGERTQFAVIMALLFGGFSQQYESYRAGEINEKQWKRVEQIAKWYLVQSGVQIWWQNGKAILSPAFATHMEQLLGPPEPR